MKRERVRRHAIVACGVLVMVPMLLSADERRSRTLFDPGSHSAKNLILTLDPANAPPAGSEISVYLPIRFAYDSAELSATAMRNLSTIAEALSAPELQGVSFVVEGHTDASGTDAYNRSLSVRRANSALQFLVSRGVHPTRLVAEGRGEANLLPGVDPRAAQQRRVEFVRRF